MGKWNLSQAFASAFLLCGLHTDKKEKKIFLIYKEIQNGAVAKSYMTNGFLIYGEIFSHFLIYKKGPGEKRLLVH